MKLLNKGNDGERRIACALIEAMLREGGVNPHITRILLSDPDHVLTRHLDEVASMDLGRMDKSPEEFKSFMLDLFQNVIMADIEEFDKLRIESIIDPTPSNVKLYKDKRLQLKKGLNLNDSQLDVLENGLSLNESCCFRDKE